MHRAVAVATLVVLAGCSLPASPFDGSQAATVDDWSETTFVVGVDVDADDNASKYVRAVENATAFWETNAEQYLGHPVEFTVDPDADDPDLVVRVVGAIEQCGSDDHAAGCAPYIEDLRVQADTVTVRIRRGFNQQSTSLVTTHEFGHVLGLNHADEPQAVMQSKIVLASTPERNATERPVPWSDPTLSVFVDDSTLPSADRAAVQTQVDHAIDYYNDGGEGTVPENVTFVRTDDRSSADVVVSFPESPPCGEPPNSCSKISGVDPDNDGARERFTSAEIFVSGLSTEAVGWHVGRWFGAALGADDHADLPPAFRDASFRERRSDWWT